MEKRTYFRGGVRKSTPCNRGRGGRISIFFAYVLYGRPLTRPLMLLVLMPISNKIKTLGIILGNRLTFDSHVASMCASCFFHIRAFRHIRPILTQDMAKSVAVSLISSRLDYCISQEWAQDLLGRDRDQDRDLSSRDRDETETFAKLSETRPRRDPRVSETRPRRDLFLVETKLRHMAYKCMVYALHTVSQKKNPLD